MRIYGGLTWGALADLVGLHVWEVAFGLFVLRERGQTRAAAEVSGGINLAFSNERPLAYWRSTCDTHEAALAENNLHIARVAAQANLDGG